MARIRTVKPEFWTDEKTGTLSGDATKVMIALLNHADDFGVIEYAPLQLCALILPFREGSVRDAFERPLAEITAKRLIESFEFDGRPYLYVRNFQKHQRINRPSKPLLPDFDKHPSPAQYLRAHETSSPDSVSTHPGREGKGREGNGVERNGSGVERNGSEGDSAGSALAAPTTPPGRTPEPAEPAEVLGRDFTLADVQDELGIPRDPLSVIPTTFATADEHRAKAEKLRRQIEAVTTPEERAEAERALREADDEVLRKAGSGS